MWTELKRALVVGSSGFLLAVSLPAGAVGAQEVPLSPSVQVAPAISDGGTITFHGIALNCATGQAATRVVIYDTADESLPYVGDASMDTMVEMANVCGNRTGLMRAGFSVIFNRGLLRDGAHALVFAAEFPDGSWETSGADLVIRNLPPYESQENGSD